MNKYLKHYSIAVQNSNVSGFELLDMLMARDKLFQDWASLSPQERAQVAAADQQLLANAKAFMVELSMVTELSHERQRRGPTPEQWWWYLDVLSNTPLQGVEKESPVPA
ncbi:MAG: hypothetical protein DCC55_25880 [Chloroflexi bacterium]|nr:MAG: hypothetical protein DCC55_25880 [Chloroflexota bacterium]